MSTLPTSNIGKVTHFPGKIFKALRGGAVVPTLIEVHPTQVCNQFCPHCVGWETGKVQKKEAISLDIFKTKIHDAYLALNPADEENEKRFSFSGETGDPLVCPDFYAMLDYTRIPFILITNGYGKIDPILLKADGIRISLDSVAPEVYGKKHGMKDGKRALDKVFANAATLMEWKKEKCASTTVGFGYLTGPETTYDELMQAAKKAAELGVDYINFRPFHGDKNSLAQERSKFPFNDFNTHVLFADKYDQIASGGDGKTAQCFATRFIFTIASDLNVYTCCHFTGREELKLGSLQENSLQELLEKNRRHSAQFPNHHCLAWCRGHRINSDIERIQRVETFDPYL